MKTMNQARYCTVDLKQFCHCAIVGTASNTTDSIYAAAEARLFRPFAPKMKINSCFQLLQPPPLSKSVLHIFVRNKKTEEEKKNTKK